MAHVSPFAAAPNTGVKNGIVALGVVEMVPMPTPPMAYGHCVGFTDSMAVHDRGTPDGGATHDHCTPFIQNAGAVPLNIHMNVVSAPTTSPVEPVHVYVTGAPPATAAGHDTI